MVKDERLHSLECLFSDDQGFQQTVLNMSAIKRQELCQSLMQLLREFGELSQSSHNAKELISAILKTSQSLNPAKTFGHLEEQASQLIGCQKVPPRMNRSPSGFSRRPTRYCSVWTRVLDRGTR